MTEDLVSAAVDRSLRNRRRAAETEVSRLPETGRDLLGPGANPKVGEIAQAAKVSHETFTRSSGSKDPFVDADVAVGSRRMDTHAHRTSHYIPTPQMTTHAHP